jgi:hypothetical protein
MTVISLLDEREPKAIRVATRTDIGTARVSIHARLSAINCVITQSESPFPTSWSIVRMMN